jgi:DNA transformation protein and related proteins
VPVTDSFVAFVLEQLDALGPIVSRRMFGGVGLYAGDVFFALISRDVLYLKSDDVTREERAAAGARPFVPFPDRPRRKGMTQYYSVPAGILEDGDRLIAWAREAVSIARAQHAGAPKSRSPVPPKPDTPGASKRTRRRRRASKGR